MKAELEIELLHDKFDRFEQLCTQEVLDAAVVPLPPSCCQPNPQITACTNIVEDYNRFVYWLFFGKQGMITDNDPEEQEKRLKYLDLVANAVILQNTVDLSLTIQTLSAEGMKIDRTMLKTLSPSITRYLKRYGDYVVDL